ncbi:MAG: hypothetical protein HQL50_13590 [Magnetococcales bacterium]|nr:hypothetical protein [Magnetococcales bacterium]
MAGFIFLWSLIFVGVTAVMLQHVQRLGLQHMTWELFGVIYGVLWIPFLMEAILFSLLCRGHPPVCTRTARFWIPVLIPPLRISRRSAACQESVWLPRYGFVVSSQALKEEVEEAFSMPMLFFALLILPVLAAEMLWKDAVLANPAFHAVLEAVVALIWFAFTIEFLVMYGVADRKLEHIKAHWLELVIILLPFVAFLRGLRILQMAKVARMGKMYRLRSLLLRVWKTLLLLDVVWRIIHRKPEKSIRKLEEKRQQKLLEIEEIDEEIATLQRYMEQKAKKANGE